MAHVMLIDQEPESIVTISRTLRRVGHEVTTACSGREGFERALTHPIDRIMWGLCLRDMSGLELLERLRRRLTSLPFVVVTGRVTTKEVAAAMKMGAADVLQKPVLEQTLLHCVASVLRLEPTEILEAPTIEHTSYEAHAAARLARVLVPIVVASSDT